MQSRDAYSDAGLIAACIYWDYQVILTSLKIMTRLDMNTDVTSPLTIGQLLKIETLKSSKLLDCLTFMKGDKF